MFLVENIQWHVKITTSQSCPLLPEWLQQMLSSLPKCIRSFAKFRQKFHVLDPQVQMINFSGNFWVLWVSEIKHRIKDRYYLEGRWCDGYPDCPNGTDEGFDTCGDVFGCGIGVEITGASQNKLNGLYDVGQDYWNNKPYFKHQTKEQRYPDCQFSVYYSFHLAFKSLDRMFFYSMMLNFKNLFFTVSSKMESTLFSHLPMQKVIVLIWAPAGMGIKISR